MVTPTDTSLSPSSRRRQVSPIQALKVPKSPVVPEAPLIPPTNEPSEPVPPSIDDASKPVSSLDGEADEDDEPEPTQEFGRDLVELSLLPLYADHTARDIWDGEVTLVRLILFNLRLLLYYKFLTLIYFSARP